MNTTEILQQLSSRLTIADLATCMPGLVILPVWLRKTAMGTRALANSPPRRNNMPAFMPIVPLLIWLGLVTVAVLAKELLWPTLEGWRSAYLENLSLCLGAAVAMLVIVHLVKTYFARGLRGFGLRADNIGRHLVTAVLNLVSIYPVLVAALLLTVLAGKLLVGPDFEIHRHQQLDLISKYPQWQLRIMVVITTIVVMPVFEEMLFRGLFQSTIRSFLAHLGNSRSAWLAISITSLLFALVHPNAAHRPALFALAVCLGYAYEKSGSLMRPIFIHSLFNAASVITLLAST